MKHLRLLAGLACLSLGLPSAQAAVGQDCMPYVGERMVFSVGWEFIHGGTAIMETTARKQGGYRITTTAKSNKVVDLFRKVRDSIVSEGLCVDGHMQSELLTLDQNEGKYRSKKRTAYDWRQEKVTFTHNDNTKEFDLPAGHLDVIDAFFSVRGLPLEVGKELPIPVFDNGKRYDIIVRVLKKEKRWAPWKKAVDCWVIEPILKTSGIFTSKGKMKIWITDDERRIPLKITAKLKFGSIIVRLVDYRNAS